MMFKYILLQVVEAFNKDISKLIVVILTQATISNNLVRFEENRSKQHIYDRLFFIRISPTTLEQQ